MKRVVPRGSWIFVVALAAGCASAPPPPAFYPPGPDLAPYLLDPTSDLAPETPGAAEVLEAHDRLLRTGDAEGVRDLLEGVVTRHPDLAAARVALAQALLVRGDSAAAAATARGAGSPGNLPRDLVLARALEADGALAEAALLFADSAERSPVARTASDRLRTRASDQLALRVRESVSRGRFEDAATDLAKLRRLQPDSQRTVELELDLATATGDRANELRLLRRLASSAEAASERQLRRADLEMEIGDPASGLEIVQRLAAGAPADPALAEHLRRAQFRWRLLNSPESVRRAASQASVSRADAAVLLYWCLPQVRTGKVAEARIASDVLDHPAREEIVRVINLGLMTVDETLHTFSPERPLRRTELLAALLGALASELPGLCAGAPAIGSGGAEGVCARASACGLIASTADCLPGAPLSGSEALELIRRATERAERP